LEKLKIDLKSAEARCKAKDEEIEVLKDHVTRVMLNNNEMLTFLSQAREENGRLLHGLMIEKHKNLALAKNVARSEKESQRWKSLFGYNHMQISARGLFQLCQFVFSATSNLR
jgi:hypothetical protein